MTFIHKHPYTFGFISTVLLLFSFMLFTNPAEVSVGLLAVPAILFFLCIFCALQMVMGLIGFMSDQPRKRRTVSLVAGGIVSVIVILQSAGGLSGLDVALLLLIATIAALYISKF